MYMHWGFLTRSLRFHSFLHKINDKHIFCMQYSPLPIMKDNMCQLFITLTSIGVSVPDLIIDMQSAVIYVYCLIDYCGVE